MATQKDIKSRISSVKNIRKITRAMEMVAAARLRRAEQRIEQLRPYAEAIRRMTRRAVEAAESIPSLPLLDEHGSIDRVEMLYNGYVSPMTQEVRHETLLPLQQADVLGDEEEGEEDGDGGDEGPDHSRSLWIYEPDPEEILKRLAPDYVEISIYRALLESTASEHGARMTAMRSASDNAAELIDDLTLEANRQRQADITQEIMEVVAGAEGLR